VNVGKRIRVETDSYNFERDASTPGRAIVQAKGTREGRIELPGNKVDARRFVEAYLRCVDEDIEYQTFECEVARKDD